MAILVIEQSSGLAALCRSAPRAASALSDTGREQGTRRPASRYRGGMLARLRDWAAWRTERARMIRDTESAGAKLYPSRLARIDQAAREVVALRRGL